MTQKWADVFTASLNYQHPMSSRGSLWFKGDCWINPTAIHIWTSCSL